VNQNGFAVGRLRLVQSPEDLKFDDPGVGPVSGPGYEDLQGNRVSLRALR
jgi:hypothetical protein